VSDGKPNSLTAFVRDLEKRRKEGQEEHERRMREEPEYRAEHERIVAERRESEASEKRREARERREAIARARREKGIPEKFWPYLDAWRAGPVAGLAPSIVKAHNYVERFIAGPPAWVFLFLAGTVGTGKTSSAAWFLDAPIVTTDRHPFTDEERTIVREVHGRFVTAEQLAKASTYDGKYWDEIQSTPRLVIDDLGTEQQDGKGWALANLTNLLAHRHAHGLRTVITANLTRKALEERYASHDGGRLRDRFAESAWFVELTGPSQRKRLVVEEVER